MAPDGTVVVTGRRRSFVRATIERDRFTTGVVEGLAAVVAVGAGVRDDAELDAGQRAVLLRPELHRRPHRVTIGAGDELLFARELPLHRPAGLHGGQRGQVLGEHLLLAAETAPDALAEDADVLPTKGEQVAACPDR